MAPWREQVWKLRETLRKEGLRSVDVGTVEVRDFVYRVFPMVLTVRHDLPGLPGSRKPCHYSLLRADTMEICERRYEERPWADV